MCAARLSIPKQYAGQRLSIGNSPADIDRWLSEFSELSLEAAVRKLKPVLVEINRIQLPTPMRYAIMKRLHRQIEQILVQLQNKYILECGVIAKPQSIMQVEILKRLLQETAIAFKIIVGELANRSDALMVKDFMVHAIYHAMTALAQYQVVHYLVYEPVAGGVWGELNLLYRHACQLDITELPFDDPDDFKTIDQIYKGMLLLSVLNPYRLLRGEIPRTYDTMKRWSHLCQLDTCPPDRQPKNEIIIDLIGERPPEHVRSGDMFTDLSMIRIVNISKIIENGEAITHTDDFAADDAQFAANLLKRLDEGRHPEKHRKSVRRSSFAEMEMMVGLNACHTMFCQQDEYEATQTDTSPADMALVSSGTANTALYSAYFSTLQAETANVVSTKPTLVNQADVAMGGYRLKVPRTEGVPLAVGELVCLRLADIEHTPWRLADVRWCQTNHDGSAMIGVRLIAETALPLYAPQDSQASPGLLIPSDGFENPAASLILPAGIHSELDHIKIWTLDRHLTLQLTRPIEQSTYFIRWEYALKEDG